MEGERPWSPVLSPNRQEARLITHLKSNPSSFCFSTRGRYLVALGRYYHPEEFTCSQCRKVLDEGGFFEEKGSIFCPKCYDIRYAPNCAKCKKKITGVSLVGAQPSGKQAYSQAC